LRTGEVYLMTGEARLTVGTAISAHEPVARQSETGRDDAWTWHKLPADVANSTVTLAAATGLSFKAAANTSYLLHLDGSL
jgi:hypothetical protein